MLALNLPGFAPKVAEKDGKRTIFDPVRQKYVALTPEEWVRQHFVNYLITRKSYPKELLANEVLVKLNGTSKRCDTVAYSRFLEPYTPSVDGHVLTADGNSVKGSLFSFSKKRVD